MDINGSPQVFQYPFDKQECEGTLLLPWKNNYTVALTNGKDPIKILGELGGGGGDLVHVSLGFQEIKLWQPSKWESSERRPT